MTDILFITPSYTGQLNLEINGTLLLATKLLHAGFKTEILRYGQIPNFGNDYSAFIESFTAEIMAREPKCVSFYTLWPYYHSMLRIARQIKQAMPEILVVMGGPQASATAQATMESMEQVDYICTGEGENTVVPFFNAVLRGNEENIPSIPGLYYRENGEIKYNDIEIPLCDLSTLPRWERSLLAGEEEADIGSDTYFMPIEAGRGCPFNCTFCCSSHFWKRAYRLKTPAQIVEDIKYFNKTFGIKSFNFAHDAFTVNQAGVYEVCEEIIASGLDIKWKCTSRIDCITKELALKMKQAGMTSISFGIETGSQRMQKLINKNLNLRDAGELISFLLQNDIQVTLFFMYGFPDETEQDLNDTMELCFSMIDRGVKNITMSFCRFNPTTADTEKYFDQLVYNPDIKALRRDVFGYEEEQQVILENKKLFPFFYHLSTPAREEYQYITYFAHMYKNFAVSARHVRKLYGCDNLQFYKDFVQNNLDYLQIMEKDSKGFTDRMGELMTNTIANRNAPYIKQLRGLVKFEAMLLKVDRMKEDVEIREVFDFSYLDYRANRPIEQYADVRTTIAIRKKNGVRSLKVLDICQE